MASTLSIYSQDGVWFADVLGPVPASFEFTNPTQVALLRVLMSRGSQAASDIVRVIPRMFKWLRGLESEQVFDYLFVDTTAMVVQTSSVLTVEVVSGGAEGAEELGIAGFFEEFGDFLAIALAAVVMIEKKTAIHHLSAIHNIPHHQFDAALATQPDFRQFWLNYSKTPFAIDSWSCNVSHLLGTVMTQPDKTLASADTQELSWTQALSGVYRENTRGSIKWRTPKGDVFGVVIDVPRKFEGFGKSPYYQVWINGAWEGKHYSDAYTFPEEIGYKIQVRPVSSSTNMYLTITIADLPKGGANGTGTRRGDATKSMIADDSLPDAFYHLLQATRLLDKQYSQGKKRLVGA